MRNIFYGEVISAKAEAELFPVFVMSPADLTLRRRIKSRLPFADIIRRLPYYTRFQDKG